MRRRGLGSERALTEDAARSDVARRRDGAHDLVMMGRGKRGEGIASRAAEGLLTADQGAPGRGPAQAWPHQRRLPRGVKIRQCAPMRGRERRVAKTGCLSHKANPTDTRTHCSPPHPHLRTHDDVPHTDEVALLGDAHDDGGGGHGDLASAGGWRVTCKNPPVNPESHARAATSRRTAALLR